MQNMQKILMAWLLSCVSALSWAAISVTDGTGQTVTVPHEIYKVVALTPHATELLYSAGAGSKLVGVTQESDYPEPVKALPKVGTYAQINVEAIIKLKPDLVVAWQDGGQPSVIQALRQAGIPVFMSHPLTPQDIATEIHALGVLNGTPNIAKQNTAPFRTYLQTLAQKSSTPTINSAFLVGYNPIYAVSNNSFLGKMLQLCGANNVFGNIKQPAFTLNPEALLQQQLQVVFVSGESDVQSWQNFYAKTPNAPKLYSINADLRPSLRIKSSLEQMCLIIDSERRSRH
ncbi:helical backbone metal receptor [Vitreoscilla massiliensis]|uniref:Helical backbone metal receptor n=1 Tax=Vitreoscilla massiliensis TaxID=1689272 RepID=A0ABY4E4Y2_9NEIS|nr:helical backbone metal receptor [Vitreoscilla massiliensis]UOO90388.1 helical backbone metal receptor [Vitreoscilla massiliensis]